MLSQHPTHLPAAGIEDEKKHTQKRASHNAQPQAFAEENLEAGN